MITITSIIQSTIKKVRVVRKVCNKINDNVMSLNNEVLEDFNLDRFVTGSLYYFNIEKFYFDGVSKEIHTIN